MLLWGRGVTDLLFFFLAFVGMYIGRKVGWILSKAVLYTGSTALILPLCVGWGGLVALLVYGLIEWQQPGLLLKIIMGYALGAYVSIPNFGLLNEATIPDSARLRHTLVSGLPLLTYIVLMVPLAFGLLKLQSQGLINEGSLFQNLACASRKYSATNRSIKEDCLGGSPLDGGQRFRQYPS